MHLAEITDKKSDFVFKLWIFLLYKHNLQFRLSFKDVFRLVIQILLVPYKDML